MLRMTKQADYGIVLMTTLADRGDEQMAAAELAEATGIPGPTVAKVLKLLAREGLLDSQRGVKGGYSLSRSPQEISVVDMIEALEGPIAVTECIEDAPGECNQEASCRLRSNWQIINDAVRRALETITLAELTHPLESPLVQLGGRAIDAGTSPQRGADRP